MFSCRRFNNLINQIHERSLRTVYNDTSSTFQERVQHNRSVSIYYKNIQTLTTEMFEMVTNIYPPIIQEIFDFRRKNITENSKEWDSKK